MKLLTVLVALLVASLLAAALFLAPNVPALAPYTGQLTLIALAASVLVVLLIPFLTSGKSQRAPARAEAAQPPPPIANQAEAEVVTFLAVLQEKGRFVDFLMDDITAYNDQQVGAAARAVHAGCRGALDEHLSIRSVRDEAEGSQVTVQAGYAADEYRLVGKIGGEAPFNGTLVHRGWRADTVKLPRVLKVQGDRLPTIAPAEVELR